MNYNTILPPFKWFVLQNFPYIEEDFDALTNWQLFCKLGKEMNKIIEKCNLTGEQVENLTNAFNALQEYVTTYLDNLDIQDEVDAKLDEMAQSGVLADIIAQYLQLAGVLAYDTKQAMKTATNLVDGSIAKTLGNATYQDGQGAYFKVRQIQNTDVVDDENIIALYDPDLVAEKIKFSNYDLHIEIENKTNLDETEQQRLFAHSDTCGCYENGVTLASITNEMSTRPEIMGIDNADELRNYTNRDSVSLFAGIKSPELFLNYTATDTIYTATSVQCPSLNDEDIEKIKSIENIENLIIDTIGVGNDDVPTGAINYAGLVESFDESTKTFTIKTGFVIRPNLSNDFYTPSNGIGIRIGVCSKIWGANFVAILQNGSQATSGTGAEIEVKNNRGDVNDVTVIDALSNGDSSIQYGVKSRGKIQRGFWTDATYAGYVMQSEKSDNKYLSLLLDENGDVVSYQKTDGCTSNLRNEIQVISSAGTGMSRLNGTYIITAVLNNYNFLKPTSAGAGAIIFVLNSSGSAFNIQYENGQGTISTKQLKAGGNIWLCDGNFWNTIL